MIAKQVKGSNFFKVLKYVHQKQGSRRIGGNMAGNNPMALAEEFRRSQQLNYRVTNAVYHCSLSIAPTEKLSDLEWMKIAEEYLTGMKFDKSQYVVYRHQDREHEHIHIIASRIGLDGKTVSDSWDYPRSEKVIRELIPKYGLSQVGFSQEQLRKAPTTGEIRRSKRTGEQPIRTRLQDTIDSVTKDLTTINDLVEKLASKGVETRINLTQEQKIRGISYKLDGIAFSGRKLGKAYTVSGLQKYKNVVAQLEIDTEIKPTAVQKNLNQQPDRPINIEIKISPTQNQAPNRSMNNNTNNRTKEFYRRQYEQIKRRMERKLEIQDQKLIDKAIAQFVFRQTRDRDEVRATLTQSDLLSRLKKELSTEQYREIVWEYVDQLAREVEPEVESER